MKSLLRSLQQQREVDIKSLRLEIEDDNIIKVIGWSSYLIFENLTKGNSLVDLSHIKREFEELLAADRMLKRWASKMKVKYELYYDDAGKGSIRICSEMNGNIEWNSFLDR